MTRLKGMLLLITGFVVSLWSQPTRGIRPVEMQDEKGQTFIAYQNSYSFIVGINNYG